MLKRIAALSLLFVSQEAAAESLFTCNYHHFSSDLLKVEKVTGFDLRFIVRDDGTASMIGNAGAAPVQPVIGEDQITFFETTASGNFMMTTIDFGRLNSVHSRHTVIDSDLVPSQYYGRCMIQ